MEHRMLMDKIWGTTEALIRTPAFEMHRLVIKPQHRCSYHLHQFKHNAFYVLDGKLFIDSSLERDGHRDQTKLVAGYTYTIEPGIWHQFRTGIEPAVVLEMYYTEPLSEDIVRSNVGGTILGPCQW
jgi:mannose-6-phosphate isomerase-like protein (cupin superfamily)